MSISVAQRAAADLRSAADVAAFGDGSIDLLIETARRIETCLRQGDTAARLSGDEYGILLERATRESATAVAERCRGCRGCRVDCCDL